MKNKIKGLLSLILTVLIGQTWAADPVATWTDFSTLTSGSYTVNGNGNTISDGVLTIVDKPAYIAGTETWNPRESGKAVVLAMRVTNLDLTKVSALVSLKLGEVNNQLGLMTDGEGGMDAMWTSNIRGGNNSVSTKLSTTATEYLIVFKYDDSGTYAWAIGNDGVFANYTKDTGCKGGTNEAGGDIRIGALYGAGSPATGLQIHSMTLWNTNESIEDVIAACATEEMKTNRAFVENGTGAQYTATVAENVNLSEIVWTKVADDTTVTTANLPNGAKLKIDASNNPVITYDAAFANKLIYTANPLTVTAAITPNQNDYSAIIPGIVSNPSYEIFPAGLFVGPGAVTYTATLNASAGYELVVSGNRATLKTVDSATLGIPSFGVNFYNGDAAKVAGTEAQGAYPIKGAAWTDVQGQSSAAVTSFNLADAAGNIIANTTMSLERTQGARQWGLNNMPSSALLKGYIDDSNGNPTTLTFSNIPYAQYRVIVYMSTDTANYNFAPVSIGGISYASAVGNTATATVMSTSDWGHTGPDHNANDLAEGVNYLVSPMMTSDSCVISTVRKANPRATIAAVQFIDCTAANRTMIVPGQEITLDANTKISDIDLTATEVLITVKPGVTLTFDEAVTLDSLRVVAEGTAESPVKFDATVANPFASIDSVSLEGTAVELAADIYVDAKPNRATLDVIAIASNAAATADTPQEVASTIAIASGKTLKTKGYLNFTAANTIAGTLEVVSGETTFNLAQTGFSGTVKVATGATFKNGTNDGPNYNGSPVLDIAGTLEVTGNARWSLPQGTTTTLRDGAVLKGSGGEGYNYAFDYFAGATINVEGNAEIIGNIGAHNGNKIIFNVAEGKVLTLSGKYDGAVYSGSSSLEVTGSGTLKLTNSDNNYSGSTVIGESATLEVAGGSIGNSQLSGTGALNVTGGELNLSNANGNYAGVITIAEGATLKTASQHYNPFGTGTSIVNNGAIVVASTAESSISAAISGSGSLSVKSGTLTLSGANTYKGVTVIDQGAKVVANTTNGATWNFYNVSTEPDVTVNGELEILATGEIYRGFAGTGTISVKGDVLIGNTGNRGEVSGLSRFAGTLIVDVDKTLTLITWGNPYNIVLDSLVLNGMINGQSRGAGGSTLSVTTDNLSGSGSVNIPVTLADGATLAGAVTVTGDVTVAGALTITHATAAGDTVITCANAEAVAAALTGAPQGLKYVVENGAVKLAVATVNVTIPAAPANTKWFMGETEVSGTIAVDPNTNVTLTLKAEEGYVFADGSTSTTVTVNSGAEGATVETPNVTAATPVAQVGETKYQTLQDAFAAAKAGDTITLLAGVTINSRLDIAQDITIDLNGQTIAETMEDQFGAIYVKKGATLTIVATNGGEITTDGGIVIGNYGTVIVNGGTIAAGEEPEADVSIYNFYYQADWYGITTINGGTVARIWNCGVATIAGGEVTDVDNSGAMEIAEEAAVTNVLLRDGTDAPGIEGAGTLTAPEGLTVTTMDGQKAVYADGKYTVVEKPAIQLTIDLGEGVSSVDYTIGDNTTNITEDTTIDIAESGTVVSFAVVAADGYFAPTVEAVTVTETTTVTIAGVAFSEVGSADAAITADNRNAVYAWAKRNGKSQSEVSAAKYLYADYLFNFAEFSAAEPTIEIAEFTVDPLVIKAKVTVGGETKIKDLSATGLNLNGTLKYKAAATLEALESAKPKATLDATDRFFKVVVE